MCEECAAPSGLAVARRAGDHLPRQAAHGAAVAVDQARLAGQAVAVLVHPHDVAVALAQAARREHDQLRGMAEYLGDVLAQPASDRPGVELSLHDDSPGRQMQTAGEPEQGGYLRLAAARLDHADAAELVFHQASQCHQPHSPSKICANAPAPRRGSWRSDPPPMARPASTSLPPRRLAAFSSSAVVPSTAAASASTMSMVSRSEEHTSELQSPMYLV